MPLSQTVNFNSGGRLQLMTKLSKSGRSSPSITFQVRYQIMTLDISIKSPVKRANQARLYASYQSKQSLDLGQCSLNGVWKVCANNGRILNE